MRYSVFLLAAFWAGTAHAAPVTLKCTTSSGLQAADLTIDMAKGVMRWGVPFRITQKNDRYISAAQITSPNEVGGEIFVFDRVTGHYVIAFAGMTVETSNGKLLNPQNPKLEVATYSGTCKAPVL